MRQCQDIAYPAGRQGVLRSIAQSTVSKNFKKRWRVNPYMNKKIRYSLIVAGFIVFGITVPFIILFVSGKKLNWDTRKIISTGIIALKIEPGDAEIYLNGTKQDVDNSEYKYIRDLQAGKYRLEAKKAGFYTWQKSITLEPDKVFWAKPEDKKIILFKTPSTTNTFLPKINDLVVNETYLFALADNDLFILKKNNSSSTPTILPLPKPLTNLQASPNNDYLFLWSNSTAKKTPKFLVDVTTKTLTDLSESIPNTHKNLLVNNQGEVIFLDNNQLFKLSLNSKKPEPLTQATTITTFVPHEDYIYFITESNPQALLQSLNTNSQVTQTLYTLPATITKPTLQFVFKKNLYFSSQNTLYQLNSDNSLLTISENFTNQNLNTYPIFGWQTTSAYNYINKKNSLSVIPIKPQPMLQSIIEEELGYLLFTDKQNVYGLELDPNHTLNQFRLYSGKAIKKFFLSEDKKTLWVLDDSELKNLSFR